MVLPIHKGTNHPNHLTATRIENTTAEPIPLLNPQLTAMATASRMGIRKKISPTSL
jgi:hypothetical protein